MVTEICDYAFNGCYLTEINFPNNLRKIGSKVFNNVGESLLSKGLVIPATVQEIGEEAIFDWNYSGEMSITILNPACVLYSQNRTGFTWYAASKLYSELVAC